jgi:hypothetical protein
MEILQFSASFCAAPHSFQTGGRLALLRYPHKL